MQGLTIKTNEEIKTKLLGLLTILLSVWSILYLIPEVFLSLFQTLLGNVLLIVFVVWITLYNQFNGILLFVAWIILHRYSYLLSKKEGKREGFTWTPHTRNDFLRIQHTLNRGTVFDTEVLATNQASQEEVDTFNRNGMWPWSPEVIELYKEAVETNPYIRSYSGDAVQEARKIYNQAAILRILSTQSKEGRFLLNGVNIHYGPSGNPQEDLPSGMGTFGYSSGLIGNMSNDTIQCNATNASLEKTTYTGKGGHFVEQTKKRTPVDYQELEEMIPGFHFLEGPCNPCEALNERPDYSCKYELNIEKQPYGISSIWKYLWKK
jgi:hypothetical protein